MQFIGKSLPHCAGHLFFRSTPTLLHPVLCWGAGGWPAQSASTSSLGFDQKGSPNRDEGVRVFLTLTPSHPGYCGPAATPHRRPQLSTQLCLLVLVIFLHPSLSLSELVSYGFLRLLTSGYCIITYAFPNPCPHLCK